MWGDLGPFKEAMRRKMYRRGEVVCHAGDPGRTLHLIQQGHFKVVVPGEDGDEAVLAVLGPGESFGEIALLDGGVRSATVIALEPSETAVLDRDDFYGLLRTDPAALDVTLGALAQVIRRLTSEVADLMFLDLRGRLAKRLLGLAESHGERDATTGAIEIQVTLTQEELAGMIGATRPRVNKLLGFFEDRGALARHGRRLTILKPEMLEWWANE
jgi:CRP/FNR family transcriptional regulator/CRP/FNR family cyclic AMP-dependent transcriptional regulator